MQERLHELYFGTSNTAVRTRWSLMAFDLVLIVFFIATTFMQRTPSLLLTDYVLGSLLLLEWLARLVANRDRLAFLVQPIALVDLVVILSLFAPAVTESLVFLRVLRTFRLLRSYHVLRELRSHSVLFVRHEAVIFSALNLLVFVFVIAALVYSLQVRINSEISNYIDAFYFTITTLTTTGFGDITLVGSTGRLLSVVIMIVGVSLFLRLVQAIFRPRRVGYECPDCGLTRHDPDAVHCKHCGRLLHIPTEGVGG